MGWEWSHSLSSQEAPEQICPPEPGLEICLDPQHGGEALRGRFFRICTQDVPSQCLCPEVPGEDSRKPSQKVTQRVQTPRPSGCLVGAGVSVSA